MRIDAPPRRLPPEPYLPLINVVFLLLIFFLIVARMGPSDPLPVTAPVADGTKVGGKIALYLAADGTLAHGAAVGDAALGALSATLAQACAAPCAVPPPLLLHVDQATSARRLAGVMTQLSAMGWGDVQLITATK
jgi:biopolymer transport protein ExbD